jgi:biopolymer transport protein ExbB/TolQ
VTWFHALQIAVAAGVAAFVIERVRALFWRAALDAPPFRARLVRLLRASDLDRARELVLAARPAHVAEVLWPVLDPGVPEGERHVEAQEALDRAEDRATRGLRALRIAATAASALGFVGAAIEIHWVFAGDHGLRRLQAGLIENIGLSHAVLSIALGIATSSFALGAWSVLRNGARDLVADGRRALSSAEDILDPMKAAQDR